MDDNAASRDLAVSGASDRFLSANADAFKNFIKAADEANAIILANPTAENIVNIAVKYTGAPQAAIIHGNHRLGFRMALSVDGLIALGDELLSNNDIKENPRSRLFADAFKGITW